MGRRLTMVFVALAGIAVEYVMNGNGVEAHSGAQPRFAAVPSEKGGQDIWGPYMPQEGWPKDLTTLPNHQGWTFGTCQSVFSENPNRIFVLQRGELPAIERSRNQILDPSESFPIGRMPRCDVITASLLCIVVPDSWRTIASGVHEIGHNMA